MTQTSKTQKPTTTDIARTLRAATTREQVVASLTAKQRTELSKTYVDPADRKAPVARIREALVNATWGERTRIAGMRASLAAYNGDEATLACLRAVGAR